MTRVKIPSLQRKLPKLRSTSPVVDKTSGKWTLHIGAALRNVDIDSLCTLLALPITCVILCSYRTICTYETPHCVHTAEVGSLAPFEVASCCWKPVVRQHDANLGLVVDEEGFCGPGRGSTLLQDEQRPCPGPEREGPGGHRSERLQKQIRVPRHSRGLENGGARPEALAFQDACCCRTKPTWDQESRGQLQVGRDHLLQPIAQTRGQGSLHREARREA